MSGIVFAVLVVAMPGRAQDSKPITSGTTLPDKAKDGKDVIVLFSGKPEELAQNWMQNGKPAHWKVEDGAMIAGGGNITTREQFQDFQLHVEFKVPNLPKAKGQQKGNSGVKLQGRYEIQILDSYGKAEPGTGDCGAIYTVAAPLVNACTPPETWETYDISFRAPRFDETTHVMKAPARVTVLLNGVIVQNGAEVDHNTRTLSKKEKEDRAKVGPDGKPLIPPEDLSTPGPILLQDHNNPVAFRNVWIRPLKLIGSTKYE